MNENIGKLFVCATVSSYIVYKKEEACWMPQGCLLTLVNIENGHLEFLQEETLYCTPLVIWNHINQDVVKETLKQLNLVAVSSIEEAKRLGAKADVKPIQLPFYGGITAGTTTITPGLIPYTITTTSAAPTTTWIPTPVTYGPGAITYGPYTITTTGASTLTYTNTPTSYTYTYNGAT